MGTSKNWRQRGVAVPFLVIVVTLAIVGLLALMSTRGGKSPLPLPIKDSDSNGIVDSQAPSSFVYGVSLQNNVLIKQVNTDGTNDSTAATLAKDVRDINVLSNEEVIYIAGVKEETKYFGRGTKIERAVISGEDVKTKIVIEATDDYTIDELLVSPDKKYIAWWEIKSTTEDHSAFSSRIFVMPLAGGTPKKLTDTSEREALNTKLLFFDNKNRVYFELMDPTLKQLYVGINRVSIDGGTPQAIPNLGKGKYNSWPVVSPDGKYAVFTSYDPLVPHISGETDSSATAGNINKNQLMLIDFTTDETTIVGDSANDASYYYRTNNIAWDKSSNMFAFPKQTMRREATKDTRLPEGLYTYDIATKQKPTKVKDFGGADPKQEVLPIALDNTHKELVYGIAGARGSLGPSVTSPTYSRIVLLRYQDNKENDLAKGGAYEFISLQEKMPGDRYALKVPERIASAHKQLKLETFDPNPPSRLPPGQKNNRWDCVNDWATRYGSYEACEACPLYLYPTAETKVHVQVKNAQVVWSDTPYNDGFAVTAKPGGQLIRNDGSIVDRLDYDYATQMVEAPKSGIVASSIDLPITLRWYALQLGLQGKEVDDFVDFWEERLPYSPYYFVSHFDASAVKQQLELDITPKPDQLLQIIMYFKPLEGYQDVTPPIFDTISRRQGFVAVDFSGRIDL